MYTTQEATRLQFLAPRAINNTVSPSQAAETIQRTNLKTLAFQLATLQQLLTFLWRLKNSSNTSKKQKRTGITTRAQTSLIINTQPLTFTLVVFFFVRPFGFATRSGKETVPAKQTHLLIRRCFYLTPRNSLRKLRKRHWLQLSFC